MTTTLYIVRHGQSEGNVNGDIFGVDPPLTKVGEEQAVLLADILKSVSIDIIYCSDLQRAHRTAKIIAQKKGKTLQVIPVKEIRERFFGKLEGKTGKYILEKYRDKHELFSKLSINQQLRQKYVNDMESFEEVLIRAKKFLDKITQLHFNKNILLVTHANLMLSVLVDLKFATFNELPYGSIKNTGCIKIEVVNEKYIITELIGITKQSIK